MQRSEDFYVLILKKLKLCTGADHASFDDYRLRQPTDSTVALKMQYSLDGTVISVRTKVPS